MKIVCEHDGEFFSLQVPMSASEVRYADVIDFRAHEQASFTAREDEDPLNALISLNSAILSMVKGDLQHVPNHIENESSQALIDKGYQLSPGDDLSMSRLYAHLVNMIDSYEPDQLPTDYSIEWYEIVDGKKKKCRYYVEPERAKRLLTQKAYTNGETIEVFEFKRNIEEVIKEKGDAQGNLAFTLSLQQMSILLRKEGEPLPSGKSERKAFIDERSKIFADLPFDIVLNVRFFLSSTLIESLKTLSTPYS